jgi:PAS domain S-box-containing protein
VRDRRPGLPKHLRYFPSSPDPLWARYLFACALSVLAWQVTVQSGRFLVEPISPFLIGFAAIVGAAAWTGFGPGILATVLTTLWSIPLFSAEHSGRPAWEVALRYVIYFGEGVLISVGSARLKRALDAAAASESWHRNLLETSGEAIWILNEDGGISFANQRCAEFFGTSVEDLERRNLEDFLFPEDVGFEKARIRLLRPGTREQLDRRFRRSDGAEIWALACLNPLIEGWDPSTGKVAPRILGMMTDITERKRAESALRRSERQFRTLFQNVLEGVYQSSPDGRILAANPALLSMLCLQTEAELNDVNIARDLYVDPVVRARMLERLEQDGVLEHVEYELRRRDGRIITVEENARIVRDQDGSALYFEGTLTDVTERKQIDAQLRQAQKMEAIGRHTGGIAEDFSSVMRDISTSAQRLLAQLASEHIGRSTAEHLVRSSDSAVDLTRQLLAFSHRQSVSPVKLDLCRVVGRYQEVLQEALRRVTLAVSLPPGPIGIVADQFHIEQVILNLARTASQSISEGGVLELAVRTTQVESSFGDRWPELREGEYAVIRLCDAAGGAARGATGSVFPGMATNRAILAQYGGFLMADERLPGHWDFSIYLPLAGEPGAVTPLAEPQDEPPLLQRILLVDDEPLIRELCRDMLERQGYRVLVASSAVEAEQLAADGSEFDLLVTDVVMPGGSGTDLADRLRTTHPGLRVLFITGFGRNELRLHSRPAESVLQKPFSAEALTRRIRQLLDAT